MLHSHLYRVLPVVVVVIACAKIKAVETTEQAVGGGAFGAYAASNDYTPPRDPAVLKKLQQWQDQKFGLLLTWGPYSQLGVDESWTLTPQYRNYRPGGPFAKDDRAYKKYYENLMTTFNPVGFCPEKWAAAAKGAGIKYALVMAKHCDGFCMFDTATTDYKITSPRCPFSKNPRANVVREISSAFRQQGINMGTYFSKPDWNSPYYWPSDFPLRDQTINYDTKKHPELWKKFKDFTWKQIEELMIGYGPMDILWLDGGWVRPPKEDIDMNSIAAMARKHQPGLIVVDREVRGENENYITPERVIPDKMLPYPWETCDCFGLKWSYTPNEEVKDAGTHVRNLCRIACAGGNCLMGVGEGRMATSIPTFTSGSKRSGPGRRSMARQSTVRGRSNHTSEAIAFSP